MWENDCGCVPITDPVRRVVGMLTDRDVCMAAYTQGRPLAEMAVASAMSHTVVACRVGDSVATAERLMREKRVRRLAVVGTNGRLAGVLSLSDIASRARRRQPRGENQTELSLEDVGDTLGAICERPHSTEVTAAEAWVAWTGTPRRKRRPEVARNEPTASAATEPAATTPNRRRKPRARAANGGKKPRRQR
jgi:CBS-domain-containing membrane protein